jgi:hypothetical protein
VTLIDIDDLKLRRRAEEDQTRVGPNLSIGRSGGDDYWAYRVDLSDKQALIGFPKHGTIGIDFLHNRGEDLPYSVNPERLADFFAPGRLLGGDAVIPREHVIRAIKMIREAVVEHGDGDMRCMGQCIEIRNNILWGRRDESDDPTKDLPPHWSEDCPLGPSTADRFIQRGDERDADGWPIEEDDDELDD